MQAFDGFEEILEQVFLIKKLYAIDRFDIIENLYKELSLDSYYENLHEIMSSIFSKYDGHYNEDEATEVMTFRDECLSDYFVYAWEYGKIHKIPYIENPYLIKAQEAASDYFGISYCTVYKLMGYTKTKEHAQKSSILFFSDTGCGCDHTKEIAYGLINFYQWLKAQLADFKPLAPIEPQDKREEALVANINPNYQKEAMAA